MLYESKNSDLPVSSKENPITKVLYDKSFTSSEIRDPVFTSSTVILDEYAHMLLTMFEKVSEFAPTNVESNMNIIKELSESEYIDPELVLAFTQNKGKFEVSVKLESPFSAGKMTEDRGNDPYRYEIGTDLMLDTSIINNNGVIQASNSHIQIIR
jgi:hypothetical protein